MQHVNRLVDNVKLDLRQVIKVIPQKEKLANNFFENFPWMFPTEHCLKKYNEKDKSLG